MRVSRERAAENRERILTEAARLFRERGASGGGVDALTEAAGLTVGSLYGHFGSKEGLMAEALEHGYARSQTRAAEINTIELALAAYLSAAHRDNPGSGCFMATLGCDMARQTAGIRRTFTEIVRSNVRRIAALIPGRPNRVHEDDALATVATMVGAMVLARAVDDPELSDRILAASRKRLLERGAETDEKKDHDTGSAHQHNHL